MIENYEKQKFDLSNSLILSGVDVCNLPATLLWSYCEKISKKLEGPNTISEQPDKLYQAMLEGRSIVAMDILTDEIYGFAQVKPASDESKKWIFNSWTSFAPGVGKPILWGAALLVYYIDPEAQVIAKVREGNTKAQKAITETGGILISHETSEQRFNRYSMKPIQKKVYDISFEPLIPKKPCGKNSLDTVKEHLITLYAKPNKQGHPFVSKLKWLISSARGFKNKRP